MKQFFLPFLGLLLMGCPAEKNTESEPGEVAEPINEWTDLLADSLSEHWEMYGQDSIKGWELNKNELLSSGAGWDQNQDLITRKKYADFELNLEWKITPENSSGIFYHVQKDSIKPIYESAPEYQILDDQGWPDKMNPNQYTAGSYAMYAAEGASPKPVGEWNTTRIIVDYPHIEHWLNGIKVVEYEMGSEDWNARKAADKWADVPQYGKARNGHIGLQNAGKVAFRNIKIKEL